MIAEALKELDLEISETVAEVNSSRITYFEGSRFVVVPAKGHLIEPRPKGIRTAKLNQLPITDIVWVERDKEAKARLKLIKELASDVDEIIVATDWDREGEAIGYNICRHKLKLSIADYRRMYFSALTPRYVIEAFERRGAVDESLLVQGLARAIADAEIGLNITKALTLRLKELYPEVKQAFSLGRVQSPVLTYINERSRGEIEVDESYVTDASEYSGSPQLFVMYGNTSMRYFGDIDLPAGVYEGTVVDVATEERSIEQAVPLPNTNDVMSELEGLSPDEVMRTLEQLYLKGWATYPRTESKWAPREMLLEVFEELRSHLPLSYEFSVDNSPSLKGAPVKGKTAIFLTAEGIRAYFRGEMSRIEEYVASYLLEKMIETFAPPLRLRETYITVRIADKDIRLLWRKEVLNPESAVRSESEYLNEVPSVGDVVRVIVAREQYVSRYVFSRITRRARVLSDRDVVEWMMRVNLGTEATRHEYVPKLKERHYLTQSNVPTLLGVKVAQVIEKIGITTELTAEMERKINELERLDDLPKFKTWVDELTREFVEKLKELPDEELKFRCGRGHEVELVQYGGKGGIIVAYCPICNKKIPLF